MIEKPPTEFCNLTNMPYTKFTELIKFNNTDSTTEHVIFNRYLRMHNFDLTLLK